MLYSSLENSKIKELRKLKQKKYRDKSGLFLAEGEHLVLEAYKSGYLKEVLLLERESLDLEVPISYVTENVMKSLSSLDTVTPMIGVCVKKEKAVIGDRVLILDEVQDPGNMGTIIRSAVAFNVDTIILSENCADIYSSKVVRASQGLLFYMNFVIGNLEEIISKLKNDNYFILGTKVTKGNELKSVYKSDKFAIIMGNEGNGVKDNLLDLCDEYIYIKMNEKCESLNVGVATSIILYELDKR